MAIVQHSSVPIINKFLNLERGHYLIIGQGGPNGKSCLCSKLLSMVRSKYDINTTKTVSDKLETPAGTIYKAESINKLLGGEITIRVITQGMKKSDIPKWILDSYLCIYLPYKYVENPNLEFERQQQFNFMDTNVTVEQLHNMTY